MDEISYDEPENATRFRLIGDQCLEVGKTSRSAFGRLPRGRIMDGEGSRTERSQAFVSGLVAQKSTPSPIELFSQFFFLKNLRDSAGNL